MNTLSNYGDKRMTVREVSEALGVDESTIRRHIKAIREDLGNVAQVQNGVATLMTEAEVTAIKLRIERSGRNDLRSTAELHTTHTRLERTLIVFHALEVLQEDLEAAREEIADLAPRAAVADRIADATGLRTLSEVGKINGLGPRKIFELLESKGIIYRGRQSWLPKQEHIDAGRFRVKERTFQDADEVDHLTSQLYVTGKGEVWLAKQFFPAEAMS